MENKKTFLGLDIGTDSVGWAVTDGTYQLKKYKNNLMWGVHLFDEANQSAERRNFRTSRRRLDRRQNRVKLLQEFFAQEVLKTDKDFFMRIKESALLPEDSEHRSRNIFFDEDDFCDRDYYDKYPTIHHLICELMNNPEPHDVRLVYNACAYILAHRGHFLFSVSKDNVSKIKEFTPLYDEFYNALENLCENIPFDKNADDFSMVLKSHQSVSAKDKEFKKLLFGGKTLKTVEDCPLRFDCMTKLISGGTVKLSDLFSNEEYIELEKNSVCIKNADFSDTLEMLEGQLDETHFNLLIAVKALYDWSLLVDILGNNTMISEAKVEVYETHKNDLKNLKFIIRKYCKKEYSNVFRDVSDKPNYVSYVYNASSDDDRSKYKYALQEDFCKFIKNIIKDVAPSDDDRKIFDDVMAKCESLTLCPKQVTTDNRVIPYQLYYAELKKIIENASHYLEFLNEKDEYGTVADKILTIMEFRIPYYAGPLVSNKKRKNAWLVRKAEGKIYPWNFADMVDEDSTENEFIRRMTCKCTYMAGEDVLPKYSLLYSKFTVLNEINNITVNGIPVSVEDKQFLYESLFVRNSRKVTKKRIKEALAERGYTDKDIVISGIDDTVKSSLKSYHDFKRLIESGTLTELDAEKIIERITVTTDLRLLKKWLKENFSQLSDDDIRYISTRKYKDYGRLSRRFLEELYQIDIQTGEVISENNIITMLWETNENLMKLLSQKYGFSQALVKVNKEYYAVDGNKKSLSDRLKDMYIPTAVQRSVTRTLDIVKELKGLLKKSPDKIFIEMARGTGDTPKGKRTKSRREQILEFLNSSDADNVNELKTNLDKLDDGKLRSEKFYLYFMQLGKCMYTGKSISFEDLEDNHRWNIDHIWPQSKVKDDSIDNKVLVDTNVNGSKSDAYPLASVIREKMSGTWYHLHKNNLISEKKYQRLVRSTPFTDEELSGFIARQLVETRQSTKAVAELLKEYFPETEIVYVKAGLVSEFRQGMDMLKCREINDLHHAKDAYLNIVMGNVYNVKFTHNPMNFVKSKEKYSMKLYDKKSNGDKTGLLCHVIQRNGETAWNPETSFEIVRRMMSKNSIRYVRYAYKRNGGLFNQMPERKKEGLVPRKKGLDTKKYGGYNNKTASFYTIAKVKNEIVFAPVDLMYKDKFLDNELFASEYIFSVISEFYSEKKMMDICADDISFPLNRRIIKINTVLEIDGFRVNICGKDSKGKYLSVSSAVPMILDEKRNIYFKKIESAKKKYEDNQNYKVNTHSGLNKEENLSLYEYFVDKMKSEPFSRWQKFNEAGMILENGKELFENSDLTTQTLNLFKIASILKTGRSSNCDLKFAGGVANFNTVRFSSVLNPKKNSAVYMIDQSPTGLYEKKSVNLLEL